MDNTSNTISTIIIIIVLVGAVFFFKGMGKYEGHTAEEWYEYYAEADDRVYELEQELETTKAELDDTQQELETLTEAVMDLRNDVLRDYLLR